MWHFGYLWGTEKNTSARDIQQLVGPTADLYLDQGNHNVVFLNRLFFFSHARWKEVCSSIHHSALYLCLPRSLPLTHSTSFVLSPLNTPSLDSMCSVSHIFCYFCLSPARFSLFLSSAFSYFLHKLSFLPLGPHSFSISLGFAPRYSSSSSAAASELSRAHLPQEQP